MAGPVGLWQMEAHREFNQGEAAIRAGEKVMEANRDLLPALITLGELLVNLRTAPAEFEPRAKREYEARVWAVAGQRNSSVVARARRWRRLPARCRMSRPSYDSSPDLQAGERAGSWW